MNFRVIAHSSSAPSGLKIAVSPSICAMPLPSPVLAIGPAGDLYSYVPKNSICSFCWPSAQILNSLLRNFQVPLTCAAVTSLPANAIGTNPRAKRFANRSFLVTKIDIELFRRRDQIDDVNVLADRDRFKPILRGIYHFRRRPGFVGSPCAPT